MHKAGLIIPLLLGGCVSHGGIRPLRPLEIATAPYQEVATAALTGSLAYEHGCLLFRGVEPGIWLMPVWPTGSSFNGTGLLFHEPGKADQRTMIGEELVIEGQPLQWQTLGTASYLPFHQQCGAQPFFVSSVRPAD